jgi:PAS domain S-box-containing protein
MDLSSERGERDQRQISLAYLPPTARQTRLTLVGGAVLLLGLAVSLPFAGVSLPRVNGFIPAFDAIISVADLITAGLLLAQFTITRSRAIWALACGYLFSAAIVVAHALTFPGAFSPTGDFGVRSHLNFRVYLLWHLGLPVAVFAYVWLRNKGLTKAREHRPAEIAATVGCAGIVALVSCIAWLAILPPVDPVAGRWLTGLTMLVCATALSVLWLFRRSVLDQWLMIVMLAMIIELAMTGLIGGIVHTDDLLPTDQTRIATLGFYIGRLFSLVTSTIILIALLAETSRLYAGVARANTLASVVKASQDLSREIELPKLIERLMAIALRNAGADRGLLILTHETGYRIEAEALADGEDIVLRSYTSDDSAIPETIIRHAIRTQERVILGDAAMPNPFSEDPCLGLQHCRSVLCLPLVRQGMLCGLLYLENTLAPHIFTPERARLLELLASQAAISLENANLYSAAKEAEEKIRQGEIELRQILDIAPQHVYVLEADPSAPRLYANQAALDYFGLTFEEWRTYDPRKLFHPDDWERASSGTQTQVGEGLPHEVEIRLRSKNGKYRWFLSRRNPLRDELGRLTRWYTAATDIEDRKAAEQRLEEENVSLREEIDKASMFEEIVGGSPPLKKVLSRISKVAPTDSSVLITGETGTGKELVARAIHRRSGRSSYPFVSVNCAVIPRDLIASELFGHEKGAFTGATQRRLGRFELAAKGTIFLDEVGELPAETQIALLRVLQEHEFERVGGTGSIQADVRVVAATNCELEAAIAAGTFRSDLYYRLNVFPIEIPTLRERREDIPLLVAYFLNRYARKAGRHFTAVDKKSLDLLQAYAWPGNIRELQNVIERSVIVNETQTFSVDESWLSRRPSSTVTEIQPGLFNRPPAQEKAVIEAALRECGGRVYGPCGAAAKLGIPRTTLESKIKSLKIAKNRFRGPDSLKDV